MTAIPISDIQKHEILKLSRNALVMLFDKDATLNESMYAEELNKLPFSGAFVSFYNNSKLRGCIGRFNPNAMLSETISDLTQQTAFNDTRFDPVEYNELNEINIEISFLTPLEKIDSPDQFELGKHGIYIKQGYNSGTFLPQVAAKTDWTKEEFLGHCSRDKAHIGWDGWRNAELYRYEAIVFSEADYR